MQTTHSLERCRYADTYKAIHAPRCNGGNPCHACADMWARRHRVQHDALRRGKPVPAVNEKTSKRFAGEFEAALKFRGAAAKASKPVLTILVPA